MMSTDEIFDVELQIWSKLLWVKPKNKQRNFFPVFIIYAFLLILREITCSIRGSFYRFT